MNLKFAFSKSAFIFLISVIRVLNVFSQSDVPAPALKQSKSVYLTHATIHIGDGKVLQNATIAFDDGKIILVAENPSFKTDETMGKLIDCTGKHIYPGIIGADVQIGPLEYGKAATLIVSSGDALDKKTSNIEYAFIDGRQIDLNNKQKKRNRKCSKKCRLK